MWRKPWFIAIVVVLVLAALGAAGVGGLYYQRYQRNMAALAAGEKSYAEGDYVAAKSNFTVYLAKYPNDYAVLAKYADATSKILSNRVRNVGLAGGALLSIARANPNDQEVINQLLKLYKDAGQWPDLEYVTGFFLNQHPNDENLEYYHALALGRMGAGRRDDAVAAYRDLIAKNTKHYDVYGDLALILRQQLLNEQAQDVIDKLVQEQPDEPMAYVQAARYYLAGDKVDKAAAAFQKAYELNPDLYDVLEVGARVALTQKNWEKALELAQKAHKQAPEQPDTYLELVMANQHLDNIEQAIDVLKNMDPLIRIDRPELFLTLCELQIGTDKLDDAKATLDQFTKAYPDRMTMLDYLKARLMFAEGNTVNAANKLLVVSEATPGFAPARFYLILAYLKMHQRDRAQTALENYLRTFPDDDRARALYQQQFGVGATAAGAQALANATLNNPDATAPQLTAAAQQVLSQTQSGGGADSAADAQIVDLLRKAIEKDASYGPAYVQLANVYIARRDQAEAEKVLSEAAAAGIPEQNLLISKAGVALLKGDTEAAKALFEQDAARKDFTADDVDTWINVFGVNGDIDAGLDVLKKAIDLNVGNAGPELAIRQVAFCTQYGAYDKALAIAKELDAQGGWSPDVQRALNEEKLRLAEAFIASKPPRTDAAQQLLQEVGRADQMNAQVPLLEARLLLNQDPPQSEAARKKLEEALEIDPNNVDVLMMLYRLLMQQGNAQDALVYAQRAMDRASQSVDVQMAYARVLIDLERNADAQDLLERLLDQHPERTDALQLLVRSYSESGRYQLAELTLDRLAKKLADQPEQQRAINALRAGLAVQQGRDLSAAETELKSLYAADPDDFATLRSLAWAIARQDRYPEAVQVVKSYISRHDDVAQPWVLLGQMALAEKPANTSDASSAFTRALLMDADSPGAIRGLIEVRMRDGNYAEAQALADRYLTLRPDDALVLYWKARLLAQQKDKVQEALDTVNKALVLDEQPDYYFLRGTLYLALDKYQDALDDLRHLMEGGQATSAQVDAALAEAYIGLGDMDLAKNFLDSAQQKAERGDAIDPANLKRLQDLLKQKESAG